MAKEKTVLGSVQISPEAVASIAYQATVELYGVVGLAPKNIAEGLAHTITREPTRGITVDFSNDNLDIDVHVILEYGIRITTVADSIANSVRYHVEKGLGIRVHNVNVHIQGLHIDGQN